MNDVKSVLNVYFEGNTYSNIVTINQYDSGVKIKFVDLELPDTYEVIFGTDPQSRDGIPMIGGPEGVEIPYDLTRRGCTIYCWPVYRMEDGAVMTKQYARIHVERRSGVEPGRSIGATATPSATDQLLGAVNDAVAIARFHPPLSLKMVRGASGAVWQRIMLTRQFPQLVPTNTIPILVKQIFIYSCSKLLQSRTSSLGSLMARKRKRPPVHERRDTLYGGAPIFPSFRRLPFSWGSRSFFMVRDSGVGTMRVTAHQFLAECKRRQLRETRVYATQPGRVSTTQHILIVAT